MSVCVCVCLSVCRWGGGALNGTSGNIECFILFAAVCLLDLLTNIICSRLHCISCSRKSKYLYQ